MGASINNPLVDHGKRHCASKLQTEDHHRELLLFTCPFGNFIAAWHLQGREETGEWRKVKDKGERPGIWLWWRSERGKCTKAFRLFCDV